MKLSDKELSKALHNLAKYNNLARVQRDLIIDHCLSVYGVEPGDVDNDFFIDFDNGCGATTDITAEDFHNSMLDCINRHKIG